MKTNIITNKIIERAKEFFKADFYEYETNAFCFDFETIKERDIILSQIATFTSNIDILLVFYVIHTNDNINDDYIVLTTPENIVENL